MVVAALKDAEEGELIEVAAAFEERTTTTNSEGIVTVRLPEHRY